MIARIWRGATEARDGDAYARYLDETGVREYRETPGNQGVLVLRRRDGDLERFELMSFWPDMDAVRGFSPEPERAVYYPRDDEFLVERELTVTHLEVERARGLPADI
jgi:heme-degrading monooxygenase HmoA